LMRMIRVNKTILLNSIIAINVVVIATIGIVFGAGEGQLGNYIIGWGYFKPYTMDSNILAGIMAILVLVYSVRDRHNNGIPRWLIRAYLMGTTCLVLTFLIAATFLAPVKVMSGSNYFTMFSKDMFFFHFLNPLLAVISFLALADGEKLSRMDSVIGMIPTIVYSIIYFVMVVVLKLWNDFYHFTFGGKYYLIPIVVVVIYGTTYTISSLLIRIHNHFAST